LPQEADHSISLPHDADLPTIFKFFGLSDDVVAQAQWAPNSRTLFDMAVQYHVMAQILRALGIDDPKTNKRVVSDSREFTGEQILASFQWSLSTYSKNATWFNWADKVAKSFRWRGEIPAEKTDTYHLYAMWRGIVYIWGHDGCLKTGITPRRDSESDELCAYQLKQGHISTRRTEISNYIDRISDEGL